MSTIKSSAEDLTLNADGSGNDIKFQSNAVEKASLSDAGLLTTSGGASLDGAVTINETGADVDFRVESDTDANALFVDGSTGNVGIGTNDPNSSLTVEGDGARIGFSNTATYPCTSSISGFRSGTSHGNMYIETAGGGNFSTPVERIAIEGTGGDVRISTGNLVIGTAGKGIDFSANSNAGGMTSEVLDDYEEGTYVPTITGSTSGSLSCSTYNTLSYTKIGRICTVMGKLIITSDNSLNGTIMWSLPFTSATATLKEFDAQGVAFMRSGGTTITGPMAFHVGSGATTMYINYLPSNYGSASENIGHTLSDGSFDVWVTASYVVA